jgi:hypothetical protein
VSFALDAAKDKVSVLHSMAKKFMALLSLKRFNRWVEWQAVKAEGASQG